ncbi:MAG: hypothetical protein K2K31_02425, partial [Clostridia bacterium]|nr:hypothetical protein [Clostridia bacterium]
FQENPNNNEIAFSLGKNMYYSKYFSLISRAKQGKEILHNLAIRPYSKNFLDYIDQVKKKKDNENMDKLLDKTGTFKESSSNGGKDKQK